MAAETTTVGIVDAVSSYPLHIDKQLFIICACSPELAPVLSRDPDCSVPSVHLTSDPPDLLVAEDFEYHSWILASART